jgi:hypothetical protein
MHLQMLELKPGGKQRFRENPARHKPLALALK